MFGQMGRFLRHALRGARAQAVDSVTPVLTEPARLDFQHSWDMATGYALIDGRDEAIDWIANSIRRGLINNPFLSRHDPRLANIRHEKRFVDLMASRSQWERLDV